MPDVVPLRLRSLGDRLLRLVLRTFYRIEVTGAQNIPAHGPFIAIMNHIYFVDPVLVTSTAPRLIIIMSKIENYDIPVLGSLMRHYGTFPIHRGETDLQALRMSLKVLQSGFGLLMAPEGTRSHAHSLQEGRDGLAFIALRSGAPIVPVGISGQEHLVQNLKRLRRTPVRMVIGEAFVALADPAATHQQQLQDVTHSAMVRLAAVLPEEYRGVYAHANVARSRATTPSRCGSGAR
jgi:1-acyl-sn-glycerol-3-phosphate acyltransferase